MSYSFIIIILLALIYAAGVIIRFRDGRRAHGADETSGSSGSRAAAPGSRRFNIMAQRVQRMVNRHESDKIVKVVITDPDPRPRSMEEIGRLTPGSLVWVSRNTGDSPGSLSVYSGGYCIGRISLEVAVAVEALIGTATVTGSYVDRIETVGGRPQITLVVYYSDHPVSPGSPGEGRGDNFIESGSMVFCQN